MQKPTMPAPSADRTDGMINVMSGLGTQKDVASHTQYRAESLMTQYAVESVFYGDGIGRKIVEKPAEEALRRWFTVEGDDGEDVVGDLETLKAQAALTEAYVWARLYGGAGIVRLIDDGGNLEDPLRPERVRRVIGYRVHDRYDITWTTADLNIDAMSPQYGKPEIYRIQPGSVGAVPYRIHHSRLSIIDGMRLPKRVRDRNNGWGASSLQGVFSYLMRVGANYGYTSNILRDFVQSVLKVKDLADMLANGQDDLVRKRLSMLDLSRSIINGMVIDADGEDYMKSASSVAGVADLMDRHAEALCSAARMPMTELFGRSPAGMNSSGSGETRSWYGMLESERNAQVGHVAEDMVRDVYLARGGEPDQWQIKWASLYTPTDEEQAATDKTEAETAEIYWQSGALDADEIRERLGSSGKWELLERSKTSPENETDPPVMPVPSAPQEPDDGDET
ncbi:MAG: hypothetical protein Unbinned3138contig1000_51 [Prokaryotic dsDNA virus sp.]|nr:MAG: hypothetical protein Unbinned3138contig1000_51 [Prokaryotic dsDNA virus sp.]|tara:strand:- start:15399 stop:16751 length:1353 start_codon:yes stop_codon:yes gene_type:complete